MNIHKHMEAIFLVTLVVVSASTFAFDSMRDADTWGTACVVILPRYSRTQPDA
jgi:hypothetical protein